jgi:hypothetical protein
MRSVSLTRQLAMPGQARRRVGEQGHHGQRHGGVGDGHAVDVERLERPGAAAHLDGIGFHADGRTHGLCELGKPHVALQGRAAHALDAQGRPCGGNGAQRDEVGRRRGVPFHVQRPGCAQPTAGGNREALPSLAPHRHAEALQQRQRDLDVGLGNQLALDLDHQILLRHQGQRHQERGEELAGDVAAHAHRLVQAQRCRADGPQRRIAGLSEVLDLAAQAAQRIDQVLDGPLVHARHAAQRIAPTVAGRQQRQRGGQGAHRRAGVAKKQLGLGGRQPAAQPLDDQHAIGLAPPGATQALQRVEHHGGVVRLQQVVDAALPFGERGQQQQPVGDGLGARQAHRAGGGRQGRNVEKRNLEHRTTVRNARKVRRPRRRRRPASIGCAPR